MAKNSYSVFFACGEDEQWEAVDDLIVANRGEAIVSFRLPREPSYNEMMQLERAIVDDKPETLVREIVAGWLLQLSLGVKAKQ